MNQDPDSLADEGTWHQPLPRPASGRPHDPPTLPDSPPDPGQGGAAPTPTKAAATSPAGKTMDPDSDFPDEDEGTWHQPLRAPASGRPHDSSTLPDSPPGPGQRVDAPESTNAAVTSSGEVSEFAADTTSDQKGPNDPVKTQANYRDGSSGWDMEPPPVFEKGGVVFGKYRLIEKIGEGGMGEVWLVHNIELDRKSALKLIKAEIAQNDKGWRRFKREAQLMAKIDHTNAVAVYDFMRTQSVGYIEMEFVRGRSLTDVLKERGDQPMPLDWTARILDQLCSVLQEVHGHVDEETGEPRPIIHRDLKPSNLMLVNPKNPSDPPKLKVLDFGIAKMVEEEGSPELTGAGDLIGTPAYMSPEQIQGGFERDHQKHDLDGRSDLYSTGVVLYHLLTGTLPFRGSKMALLAAHLNNPPLAMREANPKVEIPPAVERVVMQCLEKDPAKRPQSARALAEQFLKAAGTTLTAVPPPSPVPWLRVAGVAAAALLGVGLVAAAMIPVLHSLLKPPVVSTETPPVKDEPGTTRLAKDGGANNTSLPLPKDELRVPKGYVAVDPSQTVPDRPDLPMQLTRDDGASFVHLRGEAYLPVGYKPESEDDSVGAERWPSVIIRERDQVRFIRIAGDTYERGDPRRGVKALDPDLKPLKSHYVLVPGFYIQETEVTNDEIARYFKDHPEDDAELRGWKEWYAKFQENNQIKEDKAGKYPAVHVSYRMARKYARSVNGLLPTEAEWEWAAKSCNETYWFAWGSEFVPEGHPPRARLYDENAPVGPAPVRSFKEDQTQQHVYDFVGNVREMCADVYKPYTSLDLTKNAPKNPLIDTRAVVDLATSDPKGVKVVVRGGSFLESESKAMAFLRWRESAEDIPAYVGFRVVLECPSRVKVSP